MPEQAVLNTPWRPCIAYGQDVVAQSGRIVATIGPGWTSEEMVAIRSLLIAAPDLLAACKATIRAEAAFYNDDDQFELLVQAYDLARAAIAKVEGQEEKDG